MGEGHQSCSHCGRKLRVGARFCGKCGHSVANAALPRTGPAVPGRQASPGRRPAWAWPLVALLVLVASGAAAAFFLTRHSPSRSVADSLGATFSPPANTVTSTSTVPPPPTAEQAAQSLSALLAQSATDRSSIVNAVSDVSQCGPALSQDSQVFQNAAASRQDLLSQLANLPGQSVLSAPMLHDLTAAWQASAEADQDFAQWAQDEAAQGCTPDDQSDPGYQAAAAPDDEATADKKHFISLWNLVAVNYGLPTYQWDQL